MILYILEHPHNFSAVIIPIMLEVTIILLSSYTTLLDFGMMV